MKIEQSVSFALPKPWNGENFSTNSFGSISFLVGPNGSGKSRFAGVLKNALPNTRLLGTERLSGMGAHYGLGLIGDNFASGFQKNRFGQFKEAGRNFGSGIDTFMILEERLDIRIVVEATLSNLFNREISLEWDSGNLVPKALAARTGDSYRLDRDECHGIRELLVLLTHLHNDQYDYLIIDEPELNLHPQYQSFLMQEIRKVAGPPQGGTSKKGIFLITHSPYIIDLRSIEDLCSVFSFSSDHAVPRYLHELESLASQRLTSLIPRLNVHHKQLFFADNPIFVEGILDAQIVEAIQERRGVSVSAAGSCIIDVGGCEEVNKYLELCMHFDKRAYFLYDLDSLFFGNLRQCIKADGTLSAFLAKLGLGTDFVKYCGELDRKLTDAIEKIRKSTDQSEEIVALKSYIDSLSAEGELKDKNLARARVAVLVDVARRSTNLVSVLTESLISDLEGRLGRIVEVLRTKNIFLLRGGALEHHLPSYTGSRYKLDDSAKRTATETEVALLSSGKFDSDLEARYGELYTNVVSLPSKAPVDTDAVLVRYLSDYVHEMQGLVLSHPQWSKDEIDGYFANSAAGLGKLFSLQDFVRTIGTDEFDATVRIIHGTPRIVRVSHQTNAGMQKFNLETLDSAETRESAVLT